MDVSHSVHDPHPPCEKCGSATENLWRMPKAYICVDDIPGGLVIRHALFGPDGKPQKFYSKSSIRKAAYEAGLTMGYETPKPNPRIVEQRAREAEAPPKNISRPFWRTRGEFHPKP